MTKNAVLFVNSNYAHVLIELENLFTVFNYRDAKDKEQLLRAAAPVVRAVYTNESSWVPEIMDALPKLEMIALVSNGHERFDLKKARARNIRISNTPTETTGDVADLAVTLMLATARKITWAERYVRSGEWLAKGRPPLIGLDRTGGCQTGGRLRYGNFLPRPQQEECELHLLR